jgi:hypothetical protein
MTERILKYSRRAAAGVSLVVALAGAASPPDITYQIPLADRDLIEATVGSTLIIVDTAVWQFNAANSFPAGGEIYCGTVTAQNSLRKYMAPQRFFGVVQDGKITKWALDSGPATDPLGATKFQITLLCDKMK